MKTAKDYINEQRKQLLEQQIEAEANNLITITLTKQQLKLIKTLLNKHINQKNETSQQNA